MLLQSLSNSDSLSISPHTYQASGVRSCACALQLQLTRQSSDCCGCVWYSSSVCCDRWTTTSKMGGQRTSQISSNLCKLQWHWKTSTLPHFTPEDGNWAFWKWRRGMALYWLRPWWPHQPLTEQRRPGVGSIMPSTFNNPHSKQR